MTIHLARDGSALGIFTESEVREGLASGRFVLSDLAWREGASAWTPLSTWPEFATAPASAGPEVSASTVPWELRKSPESFLATLRLAVLSPGAGLADGRYAFGDWIAYAYVAFALVLPFQIIGAVIGAGRNEQMAEFIAKLGFDEIAQQISAQPYSLAMTIVSVIAGAVFAPLMHAVSGLLLWVFQRLFGYKVSIERTTSASMLAAASATLAMAPINLLGFDFMLQLVAGLVVLIPGLVIYYRALGAATGISPWVQFGISLLLWFVVCCCCCVLPMTLVGVLAAGAR